MLLLIYKVEIIKLVSTYLEGSLENVLWCALIFSGREVASTYRVEVCVEGDFPGFT